MNRQDFQRNFNNSFFGFRDISIVKEGLRRSGISDVDYDLRPDILIPVCGPVIDGGHILGKLFLKNRNGIDYHTVRCYLSPWSDDIDENPNLFWIGVPRGQMVQLRDTVAYVRRVSARDTPRGYCPRHSTVYMCADTLAERSVGTSDFELVWNIYNPTEYGFQQAIQELQEGNKLCCVLGSHLSLGFAAGKKHLQLYYKSRGSVGFVDEDNIPCLYSSMSNYVIREYVHKITGVAPQEVDE